MLVYRDSIKICSNVTSNVWYSRWMLSTLSYQSDFTVSSPPTCSHMHIHSHTCMYTRMYTRMYTHTRAHTHTHTHTYTHRLEDHGQEMMELRAELQREQSVRKQLFMFGEEREAFRE